jgi:hypothetical protein
LKEYEEINRKSKEMCYYTLFRHVEAIAGTPTVVTSIFSNVWRGKGKNVHLTCPKPVLSQTLSLAEGSLSKDATGRCALFPSSRIKTSPKGSSSLSYKSTCGLEGDVRPFSPQHDAPASLLTHKGRFLYAPAHLKQVLYQLNSPHPEGLFE